MPYPPQFPAQVWGVVSPLSGRKRAARGSLLHWHAGDWSLCCCPLWHWAGRHLTKNSGCCCHLHNRPQSETEKEGGREREKQREGKLNNFIRSKNIQSTSPAHDEGALESLLLVLFAHIPNIVSVWKSQGLVPTQSNYCFQICLSCPT